MTEAQVLALINLYIISNGNNEITADVMRLILVAMLGQPNDKVGELGDLDTTDKTSIVNAINELKNESGSGFIIHTGADDPNVTPPGSFAIGDWYVRSGTSLYQYNGASWVLLTGTGNTNLSTTGDATTRTIASDTGTDAVIPLGDGTSAGASLNNYSTAEKNKLASLETSTVESFTYTTGPFEFVLSKTPSNVDVYVGHVFQIPTVDYTISGDTISMLYDLEVNDKLTVRLY